MNQPHGADRSSQVAPWPRRSLVLPLLDQSPGRGTMPPAEMRDGKTVSLTTGNTLRQPPLTLSGFC
jgi:hypothetical protein